MSSIKLDKKEGENVGSFIFRFNKKVKRSGVLKEVRKRRFKSRPENRNARRKGALYRITKQEALQKEKKYGYDARRKNA